MGVALILVSVGCSVGEDLWRECRASCVWGGCVEVGRFGSMEDFICCGVAVLGRAHS